MELCSRPILVGRQWTVLISTAITGRCGESWTWCLHSDIRDPIDYGVLEIQPSPAQDQPRTSNHRVMHYFDLSRHHDLVMMTRSPASHPVSYLKGLPTPGICLMSAGILAVTLYLCSSFQEECWEEADPVSLRPNPRSVVQNKQSTKCASIDIKWSWVFAALDLCHPNSPRVVSWNSRNHTP